MRTRSFFVVMAILLVAGQASAYVLPADFLARMLAERRRDQKIEDLSILLHTETAESDVPIEEHLYVKFPGRLRLVGPGEEASVYVEREGKRAKGTDKKLKKLSGPPHDLTAQLLFPAGDDDSAAAQSILKAIKAIGVNTEVTALGRYEERPAYIIGARPWEPDLPQVWIDKATFLPVRVKAVIKDGSKSRIVDTRYEEFGSAIAGNWFPRVVEVYEDGELVRHAEIVQIKRNEKLPETLFDLPR